jgi:exodeoxyribonuclease VII small subunit
VGTTDTVNLMPTAKRKPPETPPEVPPEIPLDWKYEEAVVEVEQILRLIESGEMDLADVFEQFTIATAYLKQCENFLNDRSEQVELLIETLNDSDF